MSVTDCRLKVEFPTHPKTRKIHRRLGGDGCWSLTRLLIWAAANKPDGNLDGQSDEDIELAVDWPGEDGAFVAALAEVGWLDGVSGAYRIHDWEEHQPWAVGFPARQAKGKWNAIVRRYGEAEADRRVPEYAAIRRANSTASSTANSNAQDTPAAAASTAPLPTPSPTPTPTPTPKALRFVGEGAQADSREDPPTASSARASSATPATATPAARACIAMRTAGIAKVNPSNPLLLQLLERGASPEHFGDAATEAIDAGHATMAYVLGMVRGRMDDAERAGTAGSKPTRPKAGSPPRGSSPEKPREDPAAAAIGWARQMHSLGKLSDEELAQRVASARGAQA